jgi:hypothetical protein
VFDPVPARAGVQGDAHGRLDVVETADALLRFDFRSHFDHILGQRSLPGTNAINRIIVLASLAVSSLALAEDTVGGGGSMTELEVNTPSADIYLAYHGRIVVTAVSGKNNTSTEYRWGGASCGSRVLSDAMDALLQRAHETSTPIIPRYQLGQGAAKCIVGFKLLQ